MAQLAELCPKTRFAHAPSGDDIRDILTDQGQDGCGTLKLAIQLY